MFPKKGKFFPDRERRQGTEISLESVIRNALKQELSGSGRTVKTAMEWTGANERTVKNWLLARSSPNGAHLVCLMRHSQKVFQAVLKLAGRDEAIAQGQIAEARNVLAEAVSRIDQMMSLP